MVGDGHSGRNLVTNKATISGSVVLFQSIVSSRQAHDASRSILSRRDIFQEDLAMVVRWKPSQKSSLEAGAYEAPGEAQLCSGWGGLDV